MEHEFIPGHENDGLPLTRVQLEEIGCQAPLCEECGEHNVPVMMYAACCQDCAMHVSYCMGLLKVQCAGCGQHVASIAVEPGAAPEATP